MAANPGNEEYQGESRRTRAQATASLFAALPGILTFSVDVEDDGTGPDRARRMTGALLDMLDAAGARGTFFVVGTLAEAAPAMVREIAARGHEVASHGHAHHALRDVSRARIADQLCGTRRMLEDLTGAAVTGFRAPLFSLTPEVPWAAEVLAEAGFGYSSSVLPARNWLHGWPGAPRRPFLWPSGVLEVPVPLARLGPLELPVLGGMYLRYLPGWDLRRMARRLAAEQPEALWSYCHPYDLDADARFSVRPEAGWIGSLFLWMNRRIAVRRLWQVLEGRRSVPFAERVPGWREQAVIFAPT
jgi:peptidoglycan-N-acetylglucosamine deacetylase